MKIIRYKILGYVGVWNPETKKVEEKACYAKVNLPYSEANEEIAKREAYNGEYTIEDDGHPEPEVQPTQEERIAEMESMLNALLGVSE